jgi:outer membrane protein assembly factor BamB
MADITSLPVVGSRATCAVAYQGRVACFDMSNGSTLWTRDHVQLEGARPGWTAGFRH